FGVPKVLISNNGTQFNGKQIRAWCEDMKIEQHFASVAHPQDNGQVEVTNRIILNGLKTKLEKASGAWVDELSSVLWAYRTTPRSTTGETPFSLAYGMEALLLVEIELSSQRSSTYDSEQNEDLMMAALDTIEVLRGRATIRVETYKQRMRALFANLGQNGATLFAVVLEEGTLKMLGHLVHGGRQQGGRFWGQRVGPRMAGPPPFPDRVALVGTRVLPQGQLAPHTILTIRLDQRFGRANNKLLGGRAVDRSVVRGLGFGRGIGFRRFVCGFERSSIFRIGSSLICWSMTRGIFAEGSSKKVALKFSLAVASVVDVVAVAVVFVAMAAAVVVVSAAGVEVAWPLAEAIAAVMALVETQKRQPRLRVANGERLKCSEFYRSVPIKMQGVTLKADLYALPLVGPDVVLGVQWLEGLGPVTTDYRVGTMESHWGDGMVKLSTRGKEGTKE
ncbi:Unknown protein, partial [Striga hermonthica]